MTLSSERIRKLYDRIGARYDWVDFYESRARAAALDDLALAPGQVVLIAGAGTGKLLDQFDRTHLPGVLWVAQDLSPVMVRVAYGRSPGTAIVSDARSLPIQRASVDRIFASYLLDLLPQTGISEALAAFAGILKPGGRLALVSLTEGIDRPSRAVIGAWKWLFDRVPALCGGCRPLALSTVVDAAGFDVLSQRVIVEWGVPSEVIVAGKPLTSSLASTGAVGLNRAADAPAPQNLDA